MCVWDRAPRSGAQEGSAGEGSAGAAGVGSAGAGRQERDGRKCMGAVAKSAGSGPGPSGQGPQSKVKPRVLVVDDEPALVELVAEVVRTMNPDVRVLTAATLAEAEKVLNSQDVQVLVTDVHLPDGDGTALLPILRSRQPTARAIVITGKPTVDKAVVAIRGGAVDFVSKPFSNDVLAERVA